MKNKTTTLPRGKTTETTQLQVSYPIINKEALIISLPVEKRLPPPQKEFPICKWTMPPAPQGYLQGHDNDCL